MRPFCFTPREDSLKRINHLIGSIYVGSVKAYITELTQICRIIGPNEPSTKENDPTRLHIRVDKEGVITALHMG